MATITPPNNQSPVTGAGRGIMHQRVIPPPPNFPPSHFTPVPVAVNLAGGNSGTAYSETITAQNGTSPYTFSVISGALPTGTTLNATSGIISGTPSASGTFTFTIQVTDSLTFVGTQAFQIIIGGPLSSGGGAFVFLT